MAIFSVHCTVETGLVQYDTLYAAHLICNSKFKSFQKLYLISSYIFKYDQNIQSIHNSVMRVGSDTFGDPIFQKGLQNKPSSLIISVLGFFA